VGEALTEQQRQRWVHMPSYTERELFRDAAKQRGRPNSTPSDTPDPFPAVWASLQAWLRAQFNESKARAPSRPAAPSHLVGRTSVPLQRTAQRRPREPQTLTPRGSRDAS
jgi:hypothetical protein